jgi:hypothetical protein
MAQECLLVNLVVDNCRKVVDDTEDFGAISDVSNFGSPDCTAAGLSPLLVPCTATAASNLTLNCQVSGATCTFVGASPDPLNPAVSNVLFELSWTEVITGTVDGHSCTLTKTSLTHDIMVQLTTSTVSQPLTYTCSLVSAPACFCATVFEPGVTPDQGTCHLVCNASFCVEFESITPVKRLISTDVCPEVACDPLPAVPCPPIA